MGVTPPIGGYKPMSRRTKGIVLTACVLFVALVLFAAEWDRKHPRPYVESDWDRQVRESAEKKAAFKSRCESLGGIVVSVRVDNWFNGGRTYDDCRFPKSAEREK